MSLLSGCQSFVYGNIVCGNVNPEVIYVHLGKILKREGSGGQGDHRHMKGVRNTHALP